MLVSNMPEGNPASKRGIDNKACSRAWSPSGVSTAMTQFLGLILIPYFRKFSIMSLIVVAANKTMMRFLRPAHSTRP